MYLLNYVLVPLLFPLIFFWSLVLQKTTFHIGVSKRCCPICVYALSSLQPPFAILGPHSYVLHAADFPPSGHCSQDVNSIKVNCTPVSYSQMHLSMLHKYCRSLFRNTPAEICWYRSSASGIGGSIHVLLYCSNCCRLELKSSRVVISKKLKMTVQISSIVTMNSCKAMSANCGVIFVNSIYIQIKHLNGLSKNVTQYGI